MSEAARSQQLDLQKRLRALIRERRWLRRAVWIALCVDLAIVFAYLWSRHGARFWTD
jgi:hypothetical protein